VRSGAIVLATITTADLPPLQELMSRYKDRPVDFADATLVHLAQRESLSTILTAEHDDFETYRIGGRKRFTILPERRGKV
jgi:predicted nucleic acid-binding protein